MNVIICGAGQVGTHAAEVLAADGHNITIVDARPDRLESIDENMDVRTLAGNCANADILTQAGADSDEAALVAATNSDEINLLTAAVGKGLGVGKTIVRVHHSAYFEKRGLDYARQFAIDQLICPEFSTAQAVASTLRNPAAMAIENFAAGQIEVQEFRVTPKAPAIGKQLIDVSLPPGVRLAAMKRGDHAFIPNATTEIHEDDVVILVGNAEVFQSGRKVFQKDSTRRRLVIMGGPSMGVWLARALRDRAVAIRLFEPDRHRAEELADKLDWVTVLHADPTDPAIFEEERIAESDAYVALTDDDEQNILGCVWAKTAGVKQVVAVTERASYAHLIEHVGIDHAFSPRNVGATQIVRALDERPMLNIASLAQGVIEVYRVRVRSTAEAVGKPLRKLKLSPAWMIAAVQHENETKVPSADDFIHADDTVIVIGKSGMTDRLQQVFGCG